MSDTAVTWDTARSKGHGNLNTPIRPGIFSLTSSAIALTDRGHEQVMKWTVDRVKGVLMGRHSPRRKIPLGGAPIAGILTASEALADQ